MKLGDLVKDYVTGMEGVVTGHARHFNNVDRMLLQPQGTTESGETKRAEWFDVTRLQFMGKTSVPVRQTGEMTFGYGDTVEDEQTGLKGFVVGYATYLGGCLRVGIQPKAFKDGVPVDWHWLPIFQLKLVKKAKKKAGQDDDGGPMPAMRSSQRDSEVR